MSPADGIGAGGLKTKFRQNLDAIQLLQSLEAEHRPANADEQRVLARYAGWGGIPQVFDESNTTCESERQELRSLLDDEEHRSAIFTKRTIRAVQPVTSCDTAAEALTLSLNERGCIDLAYMASLTGKEPEQAQPQPLEAQDIQVRLGSPWVEAEHIRTFLIETLKPSDYEQNSLQVQYTDYDSSWSIAGKLSVTDRDIEAHGGVPRQLLRHGRQAANSRHLRGYPPRSPAGDGAD